jgi:hypothetical protein
MRGFIGDVRRRWGMRVCRFALAILLFANLVTLLPLAAADPPDHTWLVGIYDEADGDSVAWLIERTEVTKRRESVNDGRSVSDVRPPLRVIVALRYLLDSAPAFISLLAPPARAPPFERGLYDANDFDDVVLAATWLEGQLQRRIDLVRPVPHPTNVAPAEGSGPSDLPLRYPQARAPPKA